MSKNLITVDGNEAAASVAFRLSEAIAIYPITPSSPMAELCDEWASRGKIRLFTNAKPSGECFNNLRRECHDTRTRLYINQERTASH